MSAIQIEHATLSDIDDILRLYQKVAAIEGGLARKAHEITREYIANFVEKSCAGGVIMIARHPENASIVAELHAYPTGLEVFRHVLGDLTIAVDPEYQGNGIGRALFERLINVVIAHHPHIERIELIARESNQRAITLYQRIGFVIEGRMPGRIREAGGSLVADIPMSWLRNRSVKDCSDLPAPHTALTPA